MTGESLPPLFMKDNIKPKQEGLGLYEYALFKQD